MPQHPTRYPFILLGGERETNVGKVPCPRTQANCTREIRYQMGPRAQGWEYEPQWLCQPLDTMCVLNHGDPFRSLGPRFNSIAALLLFQLEGGNTSYCFGRDVYLSRWSCLFQTKLMCKLKNSVQKEERRGCLPVYRPKVQYIIW